jgi:aerotaxis receptor
MNQVAMLIVGNRGEVQDAWAASQRLESTARELDLLVQYFD